MAVDYGRLVVGDVIMHSIARPPGQTGGTATVRYSEAPLEWESVDRGFLQQKLRSALASARQVREVVEEECPTPDLIRRHFAGGGDLIADSRVIADRVVAAQRWNSSDGLLMLVEATLPGERCLVVTKLEHEQGMQIVQVSNAAGLRTYRAQYLRDLILGQGTKVFKIGAFPESGAASTLLEGDVVDEQNRGVAWYFRLKVLGCDFLEQADVLTQRFFTVAQRWINQRKDPEKRARYEMALLTEMQSASTSLSTARFAEQHVDRDEADEFIATMGQNAVPARNFAKDVKHIAGEIRRVKVQTRRGATVFVPPEMYDDGSFEVSRDEVGGSSTLSIHDEVLSMKGASGRRVPLDTGTDDGRS